MHILPPPFSQPTCICTTRPQPAAPNRLAALTLSSCPHHLPCTAACPNISPKSPPTSSCRSSNPSSNTLTSLNTQHWTTHCTAAAAVTSAAGTIVTASAQAATPPRQALTDSLSRHSRHHIILTSCAATDSAVPHAPLLVMGWVGSPVLCNGCSWWLYSTCSRGCSVSGRLCAAVVAYLGYLAR